MERFSRVWTPIMAACINCGRMAVSQLTPVSYCFWRKSRWDGPTYICWAVMHKLKSEHSRPFPEECKWKHKFVFMYYLELKKKNLCAFLFNKKNPNPVPCKLWVNRQAWFYLTQDLWKREKFKVPSFKHRIKFTFISNIIVWTGPKAHNGQLYVFFPVDLFS